MRWERFRIIVNSDSGMVNTDSGKTGKVFTINQNRCSRSAGIGVQVEPEWVFTMGRNMHERLLLVASVALVELSAFQHAMIGRMAIRTDKAFRPSPVQQCLLALIVCAIIAEKICQTVALLKLHFVFRHDATRINTV